MIWASGTPRPNSLKDRHERPRPARALAEPPSRSSSLWRELKTQWMILLGAVAGLWAIEVVDLLVLRGALDGYGIRPRTLPGLGGILLAPLLHGGFGHLAANSTALLVLGWFVMLRGTAQIVPVTVIGALVGGLGIWLVGASGSVHLGSSIVVFAYLGYLLFRGFFERRVLAMAGSVAVAFLYGGMIWGVLPGRQAVSWEGHLFGFLGGVLAARIMVARPPEGRARVPG